MPAGITAACHRISDAETAGVNLRPHPFHGEWKYIPSAAPSVNVMFLPCLLAGTLSARDESLLGVSPTVRRAGSARSQCRMLYHCLPARGCRLNTA